MNADGKSVGVKLRLSKFLINLLLEFVVGGFFNGSIGFDLAVCIDSEDEYDSEKDEDEEDKEEEEECGDDSERELPAGDDSDTSGVQGTVRTLSGFDLLDNISESIKVPVDATAVSVSSDVVSSSIISLLFLKRLLLLNKSLLLISCFNLERIWSKSRRGE